LGHKGKDLKEKEENENKRPEGWKKNKERGLTVSNMTKTRIEYRWVSQDKFQVEDPSIWIADTGATVHYTPYLEFLLSGKVLQKKISLS
jgi:hypothetical protein